MTDPNSRGDFLDWEAAAWWARVLTPVGPTVTRRQAEAVAAHLRRSAESAPQIVAKVTGLEDASARAQNFPRLVVDRARWGEANVEMFSALTGAHLPRTPGLAAQQGAAIELGGLLGLLSARVLGQFDPFSSRLYLVAPNIIHTRRTLGVDEGDFSMWVALHEQTHAVQFAAAPWLPGYLQEQLGALLESMSADQTARAWRMVRRLPGALRRREDATVGALTQAALTEAEAAHLERVVAVMSMLEGHADVVMDSAEPIVPTTRAIRARFTRRRVEPSLGEAILRKLIGMDAKLRQYRDGAKFVTGVVERVGHAGFNRVFESADHLPTPAEIAHPEQWVARVAE